MYNKDTEAGETGKEAKKNFGVMLAESFPKLITDRGPHIQEPQQTQSRISSKNKQTNIARPSIMF